MGGEQHVTEIPATVTLVAKPDGKSPWHLPAPETFAQDAQRTLCGLTFTDGNWHVVDDVDRRVVRHANRPVCTSCTQLAARKSSPAASSGTPRGESRTSTKEEHHMATASSKKKTSSARSSASRKSTSRPAATAVASRSASMAETAKAEAPKEVIATLTHAVKQLVPGVKAEGGRNGGARTYYRTKDGKTLGFAREGGRKATVVVGRDARQELTMKNVESVAKKLAAQAPKPEEPKAEAAKVEVTPDPKKK